MCDYTAQPPSIHTNSAKLRRIESTKNTNEIQTRQNLRAFCGRAFEFGV